MKKTKFFIASFCFILSSLFSVNAQWSRVAPYTYLTTSTDKVGIGTSTPKFNLHVKGLNQNSDMMTLGSTTTGNFALTSQDGNAYGLFAGVSGTGRAWLQVGRYDSNTAYDLTLQAAGGNVGIGTTTPQKKLDIYNSTQPVLRVLSDNPAGHGNPIILLSRGGEETLKLEGYPNVEGRISSVVGGVGFLTFYTGQNHESLRISPSGYIGINTANPQKQLDVNGTIHAREVLVDNDNWADFVFDKEYALPKLSDVNAFVQTNGHLPNIPSATEVKEKGVNVSEMQAKLLQKIEELTLYVIQQDKKIELLQKQIDNK